jgi:glucose-1-phosphate thymidylyltransferase
MKVLILAAGYATRLYPLTLTRPKPLLPVAGRPMIDHVMDNLAPIPAIDGVYVVTNAKFAAAFEEWAAQRQAAHPGIKITVVNDLSTDDSNKLGAIGDMRLVIQREKIDDDLIMVAGDNLFSHKLGDFGTFCRQKNAPVLAVYDVGSLQEITKYGCVSVDKQDRLVSFVEKPNNPTSTLAGLGLYFYPRRQLAMVDQYVAEGNHPDQPGRLVQWLYTRTPVYAWRVPGLWFDIGSKENLEEANRIWATLK